jgi:hypothetical protein
MLRKDALLKTYARLQRLSLPDFVIQAGFFACL